MDRLEITYDTQSLEEHTRIRWAEEEVKRWKMRREAFPDLADDVVIFANFNQLYKVESAPFRFL